MRAGGHHCHRSEGGWGRGAARAACSGAAQPEGVASRLRSCHCCARARAWKSAAATAAHFACISLPILKYCPTHPTAHHLVPLVLLLLRLLQKYWASEVPYKYVTVQTIEAAYHATPAYQRMMAELERLPAVEEEGSNSSSGGGGGGDNCGGGALSGGDSGGGGTATRRTGSPRGEEPDVEQGAIAPSPGSPGPGSSLGGVSMRVHDHRKAALAYTK